MVSKTHANIIPSIRYRDGHAAIDFLCKAFGFERHAVYEGPDNTIAHAQLLLGNSMIMLGSGQHGGEYDQWVQAPRSNDAVMSQGIYVVVADCDAHHARAKAAGARIVRPPTTEDYGGRGYTARDLEGQVWSFGTYDPWATTS